MKKVCFVVTSVEPGGVEQYLLRFLSFSRDRIDSVVVCKSGKTGRLLAEYLRLGIQVLPFKTGYFNLLAWYRFYSFLRKGNIHTICDFTGNFAGIYMLISRCAGISSRIVFYRQSSNHFRETSFNLFYNAIVNLLVKMFATKILSNSKSAIEFFFPGKTENDLRFKIIYNGIDSNKFVSSQCKKRIRLELGIPENAFVVGHTGRYTEAKNHRVILKVAQQLCKRHSDFYFLLSGRDTDSVGLIRKIDHAGLKERVITLGYRSDVNHLLTAIDLFYFPSITEGQPNSLIEAMVCGLPVIASNIPSIKETVPPFLHDFLIAPNDVQSAYGKIVEFYETRDARVFAKAREWAIEFFHHEKRFEQFLNNL